MTRSLDHLVTILLGVSIGFNIGHRVGFSKGVRRGINACKPRMARDEEECGETQHEDRR